MECRCGDEVAELAVRDGCAGIPAEDLPHVFDRFYRGRGAESGGPDGSGLALPIARSIVEKHGGAVEVESGPECGTTVWIRLLLLPAARPGTAPPRRRGA